MRGEEIHGYLALRPSVTEDLQARIDQFYHYKWALHGGVQGETNLFGDLHPKLRDELMAAECDEIIQKISLFRDCRPFTLKRLLAHLKKIIFLPDEVVALYGDVAREMFLIQRGEFQVINRKSECVKVLQAGDFFGEMAMLSKEPRRTMTIKSLGYADALSLSREVFLRVFNDGTCPDFRISIVRHSPATRWLRGWPLIRMYVNLLQSLRSKTGFRSIFSFEDLMSKHIATRDEPMGQPAGLQATCASWTEQKVRKLMKRDATSKYSHHNDVEELHDQIDKSGVRIGVRLRSASAHWRAGGTVAPRSPETDEDYHE